MIALVKGYVINLWDVKKVKLCHALPSLSLSPRLGIQGMDCGWGAEKR